jgi:thiamine biosynthesis lipoprotein
MVSRSQEVLGSLVQLKLPKGSEPLFSPSFSELERIERAYSRFRPDSELSKLNRHLGSWQPASDELFSLVARAEEFRSLTVGHFDIALKKALDDLGYDENYSFQPKQHRFSLAPLFHPLSAFLLPVSPRFQLDASNHKILLHKEIEFGGLGKGYALDRVAALLESNGVSRYCINAGGDLYAKRGSDGAPWKILLEHPDDAERAIGQIELDGRALAGSAPNRRKWGSNGQIHHLLNAKTGKPAQGMKAIFVLAKTGIEADAYSTALFTSGFEDGIELSKRLPVEMLSISSEDKMYQSPGFNAELFG